MSSTFRMIQLNVRKQGEVHDSLMNDEEIKDATVLAIQEPQAHRVKGRLLTTPMGHHKWTKIVPSSWREERWPIRSMLWVNKEVEAEQIPIDSPDMTVAIIRLPGRQVLVASVYVPCADPQALRDSCNNLRKAVRDARRNSGSMVDIVIAGDFNRHDQLWGGDDISLERQGEADPIIDLMNELALNSLLRRGTKTWQSGEHETTIDLTLASEGLSDAMLKCGIHQTEHGADHRAIDTVIDISTPASIQQERLLLKNATVEGGQCQHCKHRGHDLHSGHGTANDGQADKYGLRGYPGPHTQSSTITVHKAMVDDRSDATTSHLHLLEKPRPKREEGGTGQARPRRRGERSGEAVPQRYPTTEEKALGGVSGGQRQHLKGC